MKKYFNFDAYFEKKEDDLIVIHHVLPDEVKKTVGKIIEGMFDEITAGSKKIKFESIDGEHTVTVTTTPLDFKYIDEDVPLTMDMSAGVMKKRDYEVVLNYLSKDPENLTVTYKIEFKPFVEDEIEDETEEETENGEEEKTEKEKDYEISDINPKNLGSAKIKRWDELDPTGKTAKDFKNFFEKEPDDEDEEII
jgi:hypothetical protein